MPSHSQASSPTKSAAGCMRSYGSTGTYVQVAAQRPRTSRRDDTNNMSFAMCLKINIILHGFLSAWPVVTMPFRSVETPRNSTHAGKLLFCRVTDENTDTGRRGRLFHSHICSTPMGLGSILTATGRIVFYDEPHRWCGRADVFSPGQLRVDALGPNGIRQLPSTTIRKVALIFGGVRCICMRDTTDPGGVYAG